MTRCKKIIFGVFVLFSFSIRSFWSVFPTDHYLETLRNIYWRIFYSFISLDINRDKMYFSTLSVTFEIQHSYIWILFSAPISHRNLSPVENDVGHCQKWDIWSTSSFLPGNILKFKATSCLHRITFVASVFCYQHGFWSGKHHSNRLVSPWPA